MIDMAKAGTDGATVGLPEWASKPKRKRRKRTPDPAMPPIALRSRRRWFARGDDGHWSTCIGTMDIVVATLDQWHRMPESNREKEDDWRLSRFTGGWIMAARFTRDGDRLIPDGDADDVGLLRECRNRLVAVLEGQGFVLDCLMCHDNGGCEFRVRLPGDAVDRQIKVVLGSGD